MNIKNFLNESCEDESFDGESFYIEEGCRANLKDFLNKKLDVEQLKTLEGDTPEITFSFCGEIYVRVGVFREGYSFSWLQDHEFSSLSIVEKTINIDLTSINNGDIEIFFTALKESAIFGFGTEVTESKIEKSNILFNFIFPTLDMCCEEGLYYRVNGSNIYFSFGDRCIRMGEKTAVDLNTYFNSLSVCKWTKYTNIKNISAFLDFCGDGEISIVSVDKKGENILYSYRVNANKRNTFILPIQNYPTEGILGIRILAKKKSILYGGGWLSSDPATQEVNLGIGITTFKREKFVKSAVARLTKAIAEHPIYNSIDVTVVDNGKTLSPEDVDGATLIPNENLGGTGGFTRNLLHYKYAEKYTHVLFMDDDASCEPSSVFRSVSFMRHVLDDSIAISGAMLSENIQFIQWENGAYFDKCCHPFHCNYDLRDVNMLVQNEDEDEGDKQIYGAWWFFMFPLKHVSTLSFPFFVRGDDIEFSYLNKFNIVRMNGISTWQEDFKIKESPLTLYLDIRSHVMHHLVVQHIDSDAKTILKMVWHFFNRFNLAYQYDTANAIASSFVDVQKGVKYWVDNIDTNKIRSMVKSKYNIESPKKIREDYLSLPEADANIRLPFLTKTIRKITFNGHLLPSFLVKRKFERINKYKTPFANRVFLRDKILVCNEINKTEVVLRRDVGYFIKNMMLMIKASLLFVLKRKSLLREYTEFYGELKEDTFWSKVFGTAEK